MVAGVAGQSIEGSCSLARSRRTRRRRAPNGKRSRIDVTCLEAVIGTRYTADTITYLRRRTPACACLGSWGADNLAAISSLAKLAAHRIRVPIAVIDRPPQSFRAMAAPAAQALGRYACPKIRPSSSRTSARRPGSSSRNEIEPVVDRSAEPGRQLEGKEVTGRTHWNVETVNPTCVV